MVPGDMYEWFWVIFAKNTKFHDAGGPGTVVSPNYLIRLPWFISPHFQQPANCCWDNYDRSGGGEQEVWWIPSSSSRLLLQQTRVLSPRRISLYPQGKSPQGITVQFEWSWKSCWEKGQPSKLSKWKVVHDSKVKHMTRHLAFIAGRGVALIVW